MSFQDRQLVYKDARQGCRIITQFAKKYWISDISEDEINKQYFGETTRNSVLKFQTFHNLKETGLIDEPTILKLYDMARNNKFPMVSGIVITSRGIAAPNLKVSAVDKNSREKDVELGTAITDSTGNYTILYGEETLKKIGKQKLDIQIIILDREQVSKSSVHFNAERDEKINLVLKIESVDRLSEYSRVISEIDPHVRNSSFSDLKENSERQDISHLANKTGWDARLVAIVSLAHRYSNETKIPAEFYYALFRAGLSTDPDILFKTNLQIVKVIWDRSIEQGIIDNALKSEVDRALGIFKKSSGAHLLGDKSRPIGVSSLKDMLNISLADASEQQEFVHLYFNHTGDMTAFWQKVEQKFGKEKSDKLQLDGKLGHLTIDNAKLIHTIYSNNIVKNDPSDLIRNGYYKKDKWNSLFTNEQISLPKDIPGTGEEKKTKYIDYMVSLLKISYPTLVIAEMVNNDELPISGDSNVKKEVYKFLHDNHDKFRIGHDTVDKILRDEPGITLSEIALKELKHLIRIYQLSPSDEVMKAMCRNNLDSAYTIVKYTKKQFIEKYSRELGGITVASSIYSKAHQVHSTVLNMALSYMTFRTGPKMYSLSALSQRKGG